MRSPFPLHVRHNGVDILSRSECLACLLHANGVCLGRLTSIAFDYFHVRSTDKTVRAWFGGACRRHTGPRRQRGFADPQPWLILLFWTCSHDCISLLINYRDLIKYACIEPQIDAYTNLATRQFVFPEITATLVPAIYQSPRRHPDSSIMCITGHTNHLLNLGPSYRSVKLYIA